MEKEHNIDLWDDLDLQFEKYEDNITQLTLDFVKKNIDHFD